MTLENNINRFVDALNALVDSGIEFDPKILRDPDGKKLDPKDAEAYARAAERAEAILAAQIIAAG